MPQLYLAPYLVKEAPNREAEESVGARARELWAAMREHEWLYEAGDDPSFFSAAKNDGPVTWGVCRRDVRSSIAAGDVVAFFAVDYEGGRWPRRYCLVGALTVEDKVSHAAIHDDKRLAKFRKYLNLLVRRKGDGWEHFEPSLPRTGWHSDWLWRIVGRGYRKAAVSGASKDLKHGQALEVEGAPVTFGNNYVIFSRDLERSLILEEPVKVATFTHGELYERWLSTSRAVAIKELTLDFINEQRSTPRWLRIRNTRMPHRHIRGDLRDSAAWMADLRRSLDLLDG